jgi:hypothetical protein
VVSALVVATMAAVVIVGVMTGRIVGAIAAGAVVIVGVVVRRIVGAIAAGTVVVVGILGVVSREVIGTVRDG